LPLLGRVRLLSAAEFYAKYLAVSAQRCDAARPRFASIGAGVCVIEVDAAQRLRRAGLSDFTLDCIELSPDLLAQGRQAAIDASVDQNLTFVEADFNVWQPQATYQGIMVNHALYHVVNLEGLFD
jgi:tRNA1(Val) A37 N6-methylase TrmN6